MNRISEICGQPKAAAELEAQAANRAKEQARKTQLAANIQQESAIIDTADKKFSELANLLQPLEKLQWLNHWTQVLTNGMRVQPPDER